MDFREMAFIFIMALVAVLLVKWWQGRITTSTVSATPAPGAPQTAAGWIETNYPGAVTV